MDVRGEPRIGHTQGEGGMKMPGFIDERTVQGHTHVSSSQARGCMRSRPWEAVCQASVKPAAVYVTATSASKTRTRLWLARRAAATLGASHGDSAGVGGANASRA